MSEAIIATVERLLSRGDGLLRLDKHKTCLVRHVAVGDEIIIESMDSYRGQLRASSYQLKKTSKQRVSAPCPVADICGGCALQVVDGREHAGIKSAWVHDAFISLIEAQTQWLPIIPASLDDAHRRRRLRWHIERRNDAVVLGFYAHQSHQVVAAPSCMVVSSSLNALRQQLEMTLSTWQVLPESVYAVQLSDGMHIILEFDKHGVDTCPTLDWHDLPLQWWCRDISGLKPLQRPVLSLHDQLPTQTAECVVAIGPDDFVQGQKQGNHDMIEQVIKWSEGAQFVVDLFSGAGNLSLPLAVSGATVIGAEVNEASVRAANANVKRLKKLGCNVSASYQQADLFGKFDANAFVGADVLMIDPPRKGAKKICSMMGRLLPKKVILVHCDVASAGRDALAMRAQGYHLKALRALDLFPYSGHVETMSLWAQ